MVAAWTRNSNRLGIHLGGMSFKNSNRGALFTSPDILNFLKKYTDDQGKGQNSKSSMDSRCNIF